MSFELVRDNLARVREEITRIQSVEGIDGAVCVIGVTKGHPADAIAAAQAAGLEDIGENRVQEALGKRDAAADVPVRWHLIGHLQSNKAKLVPGNFAVVHSVDSVKLAEALSAAHRRAREDKGYDNPPPIVLLQVNVSGEGQKSGCSPDAVEALAHAVAQMSELRLRGLMTMAPLIDDEAAQRKVFGDLRTIRDRLVAGGLTLPELSMGMSGDFPAAVAEGATMLRLGTVLFGERQR
ncbi:MAG: YggS family pyridoxal phosphate-dependent enzyme [Gemmatimonadetes bacterium]|nr:YggS family pyridoxal phosphate-dependent enzyme [Gemmatimonadota bacterium]